MVDGKWWQAGGNWGVGRKASNLKVLDPVSDDEDEDDRISGDNDSAKRARPERVAATAPLLALKRDCF